MPAQAVAFMLNCINYWFLNAFDVCRQQTVAQHTAHVSMLSDWDLPCLCSQPFINSAQYMTPRDHCEQENGVDVCNKYAFASITGDFSQ
jgi:hypothetical protein